VFVDVMAVAFGYVLRVEGGAAAIGVRVSTWILLCTIFVALFLAFSKRRHELLLLSEKAATQREVLVHYGPTFLDQMINVVTASTLLCYALYTLAPETTEKFGTSALIYTLPFVLFGIFRYLYLVYQVTDERNPTEAILHDPPSVLNVALWGAAVIAIIYLT
jgi:4-hydroxybenzoate polyprenyltransferase